MGENIPMSQKKPNIGDYLRSGSCTGDPKTNALNCLKNGDLTLFTDIVNEADIEAGADIGFPLPNDHWINQPLPEEDDKTLLMLALDLGLKDFVEVLLAVGASASLFNEELGKAPIHLACEKADLKIIQPFFKDERNLPNVNSVVRANGWTPLHICTDKGNMEGLKLILSCSDVDINKKDKRNQPAILIAIKKSRTDMVKLFIEYGADLDAKCAGKTIRQHIKEKMPDLNIDDLRKKRTNGVQKTIADDTLARMVSLMEKSALRSSVYSYDLSEFTSLLRQTSAIDLDKADCKGMTLLQMAAEYDLLDFAKALLDEGKVGADSTTESNKNTPLLQAAKNGNKDMLELLLSHKANVLSTTDVSHENILHILLKKGNGNKREKFRKCIEVFLTNEEYRRDIAKLVNKRDVLENTSLHYATQLWDTGIVRLLLENGASIGMKNHWEEVPISKISPETMEAFLDEYCIRSKGDTNHEEFELTFNYSFLAPPKEDLPFVNRGLVVEPECQKLADHDQEDRIALPETQSLWHMCQSKDHRYLLKHPVITSFLFLKWGRIRRDFNRNLRFYLLFVFLLTWYIFETFGHLNTSQTDTNEAHKISIFHGLFIPFAVILLIFIIRDWIMDIQEATNAAQIKYGNSHVGGKTMFKLIIRNWIEVAYLVMVGIILFGANEERVLWVSLLVLTIILVIRELFQVAVSIKRYLLGPENWLEVTVIILIGIILFDTQHEETRRHLSAVAIVLSWAELITLVGKHPKLTTYNVYVTMFYKVMGTFFFFLCWYAFFIVAFGLGFYIMLHKTPNQEVSEEDYIFFNSPWLALVKTSTMFVGELEFSDIPINLDSPLATLDYLFFLSFVFLIVVVLMNLLNGLAVSDTGVIQEKAEIVSYISRVETISYTESVLLGDPFNFLSNWPALKWFSNIPSCSCCAQLYRNQRLQRLFHKMTGATDILLFYNFLPNKKMTLTPNAREPDCKFLQTKMMDEDIIKSAKAIIQRQNKSKENCGDFDSLKGDIKDQFAKLEKNLDERLQLLEHRLEAIINKLNN